jgi:hypothetical protein
MLTRTGAYDAGPALWGPASFGAAEQLLRDPHHVPGPKTGEAHGCPALVPAHHVAASVQRRLPVAERKGKADVGARFGALAFEERTVEREVGDLPPARSSIAAGA